MKLSIAEEISLKSFINAYFRENQFAEYRCEDAVQFVYYTLMPLNIPIRIKLIYFSLSGRHQYAWPAELMQHDSPIELHPWALLGLLMQDLAHRHPQSKTGHREFIQRIFNSCENLEIIFQHLSKDQIEALFKEQVDFVQSENGLLTGHQLHPMPKSREGFNKAEFKCYSPELQNHFSLRYFLADPEIVFAQSALEDDTDRLIRKNFLGHYPLAEDKRILPTHPWQAQYLKEMPIIKKWIDQGKLIDMGPMGKRFTATSSVRTLYSENCAFMTKFSLNITITNSMRMQYTKELIRGIAAHRFWHSIIGLTIQKRYPRFVPITDPAFICLHDNKNAIPETALLLRQNHFTVNNNTTSVATLCQDNPLANNNRLNTLIELVANKRNISLSCAADYWFIEFIKVAVEPILWMFTQYGIAVEAHQQNLLLKLNQGLPVASYYRDNQGYYVVDTALPILNKQIDSSILLPFCEGSLEFIRYHLIYYLICNSTFGVINALGLTGFISEQRLFSLLRLAIQEYQNNWTEKYPILSELLEKQTLPFKGNLLTRFYELDELVAPLEQQSIYIEINNHIRDGNDYEKTL